MLKKNNIDCIKIIIRGPLSVDKVLDLELLKQNGIAIDYIKDQNVKNDKAQDVAKRVREIIRK